jgi:hypothetical protein
LRISLDSFDVKVLNEQWTAHDFAAIEKAIEALFVKKGWM